MKERILQNNRLVCTKEYHIECARWESSCGYCKKQFGTQRTLSESPSIRGGNT